MLWDRFLPRLPAHFPEESGAHARGSWREARQESTVLSESSWQEGTRALPFPQLSEAFPFQEEEELSKKLSCKGGSCLSLSEARREAPAWLSNPHVPLACTRVAICDSPHQQHVGNSQTSWAQPSYRLPKAIGPELANASVLGKRQGPLHCQRGLGREVCPRVLLNPMLLTLGLENSLFWAAVPSPVGCSATTLASTCQML